MRPKLKLLLDTFMVSSPTVCLYCINEYVRSPALNEIPKLCTGRYSKDSSDNEI